MSGSPFLSPHHPNHPQQAGDSPRCLNCGARLRPEDDWCSLCLTPVAVPDAAVTARPEDGDNGSRPAKGRHARQVVDGPDPALEAQAEELLAELTELESKPADRSSLTVFRANVLVSQVPGGRYLLAFGGALILLVIGVAGLTLLGLLV